MTVARHRALWVGTYDEKGGRGLYRLSSDGRLLGEPFAGARNASFGAHSSRCGLTYLVDEQGGTLGAYGFDGDWQAHARRETGGSQPCYVSLNRDETMLAVANYGSGSTALFPLDPANGLPGPVCRTFQHSGKGPNKDRQDGPHAHCAVFSADGRWLYQVDLGTDEILAVPTSANDGDPRTVWRAPDGSGPRHLLLRPDRQSAFLVSELSSTLDVLEIDGEEFRSVQRVSTLPEGFDGESLGGHVGLNSRGDRLYVTNRGHDSIAVFDIDGERLKLLQHVPSGGASPRHFLLDEAGKTMFVANEEGGKVTAFGIEKDGTLHPSGLNITVPGPVFLFRKSPAAS